MELVKSEAVQTEVGGVAREWSSERVKNFGGSVALPSATLRKLRLLTSGL